MCLEFHNFWQPDRRNVDVNIFDSRGDSWMSIVSLLPPKSLVLLSMASLKGKEVVDAAPMEIWTTSPEGRPIISAALLCRVLRCGLRTPFFCNSWYVIKRRINLGRHGVVPRVSHARTATLEQDLAGRRSELPQMPCHEKA